MGVEIHPDIVGFELHGAIFDGAILVELRLALIDIERDRVGGLVMDDAGDGILGIERRAWCFIFYLMSMVVFHNAKNTDDFWLLPLLHDLDALRDYDWDFATYGYLLHGLDDA